MANEVTLVTELQELHFDSNSCSEAEGKKLNRRANRIRKQLPENIVMRYDLLFSRGARPLVAAVGNVCQGCNMSLPTALAEKIRQNGKLYVCESCGRFIYLPEEDIATA